MVVAATGVGLGLVLSAVLVAGVSDPTTTRPAEQGARAMPAVVEATCSTGGAGAEKVVPSRDAVLGPLVLIGGRGRYTRGRPDAFNRLGYKVPLTLPQGVTATLSVPPSLRSRVGLVFSLEAQERVVENGIRAADSSVRFQACPAAGEGGRTGWAGGFVTDRRRCADLVSKVAGESSVRYRVQLGRAC